MTPQKQPRKRYWNSVKTHCKYGHAFTKENTHVNRSGKRICRICRLAYRRARDLRAEARIAYRNRRPRALEYQRKYVGGLASGYLARLLGKGLATLPVGLITLKRGHLRAKRALKAYDKMFNHGERA